jgi:hypothetical protein
VKEFLHEQKHFTQRRKVAEDAKRTKELLFANLCALARLREIVYFLHAFRRGNGLFLREMSIVKKALAFLT